MLKELQKSKRSAEKEKKRMEQELLKEKVRNVGLMFSFLIH